jgi:glycerol-3-phosphate dehydrogenase (NAD(P)+)
VSFAETLGIVGAGTFGTALANAVARTGRDVVIWSQTEPVVDEINRDHLNSGRLPDVELAPTLRATTSAQELAGAARFIVVAVPSTDVRTRAKVLGDYVDGRHILVHAIGALATPRETPSGELLVTDLLIEETPVLRVGALAGPALPRDLVEGRYASMVVASAFDEVTSEARRMLGVPPVLRIYRGHDPAGVELAAALSGAYTIAVGISDALEVGSGLRSVLITRIMAEAARLGAAAETDPMTFYGLAGLGNLLVRASPDSGERSKEYVLGLALGGGEPLSSLTLTEGARAAQAGARMAARLGVRMPVLTALAGVIAGELSPAEAASAAGDTVAPEE